MTRRKKQAPLPPGVAEWLPETVQDRSREFARTLDPFGVARALALVQQAWLTHPQDLTEAMTRLAGDYSRLQMHMLALPFGARLPDVIKPVEEDERFSDPAWSENPSFSALKQLYLLATRWLQETLYHTPDVPAREKRRATYWVRQWLNAIAPTNYLVTNPGAVRRFWETGGDSLLAGFKNWSNDLRTGDVSMVDRSKFQVGRNLATTPGTVVFRNELLEVIHYAPTTKQVHATPVVIVAPWINKFYILDLNERKSLVRHLVANGLSVFITSWKNPGKDLEGTTFDDYMIKGVLQAIETAREVCGTPQVHAVGYCLGGTTLSALMAWLNRKYEKAEEVPVAHWTLFTTLVDFSRPGAIEVFVDEDSVAALEENMAGQGYLDGREMARAFRMLRSNSLIWYYFVHGYLYGEAPPAFDVLYWNTDVTRLPRAMHSFYLREFYLANKLVQKDGVTLAGLPIDLGLIRQPLYAIGCEEDHIAPWKAAFDICQHVSGPVRFCLSSSGHILGIINPPVTPPKRHYWVGEAAGERNAGNWKDRQAAVAGSWWEDWVGWLQENCGPLQSPPPVSTRRHPKLGAAPGAYVLEN